VALPTYGSWIVVDARQHITAVESEAPVALGKDDGREVFASPAAVAAFLRSLKQQPPPRLAGIVWFRLPVAGDQRAWSTATWKVVVTGGDLSVRLAGEVHPADTSARQTLTLRNDGAIDAELPSALLLRPPCVGVAAAGPYVLDRRGQEGVFLRGEKGLLRAGARIAAGTVQCGNEAGNVVIEP